MSIFSKERARPGGPSFLFPGLLLAIAPASHAQWRAYGLLEAGGKSEPIAIQRTLHGWKGADREGRRQYATVRVEAGVTDGVWGVGTLRRLDYSLRFTPDTAALYGTIADDRPLPVGKTYDVALRGHALEAWGVRGFVRKKLLSGLRLEAGLSLLRGTYMFEGTIQGSGTVTAPKAYDYQLRADYAYTKDLLFEREVQTPKGTGAALDCALDWAIAPAWQLRAHILDVFGFVQWNGLPYTQASAISQRTQTDDQAFQRWDPLVSGLEANHSRFRQILPQRGNGEVYFHWVDWTTALGATCAFGDWRPRVGFGKALGHYRVFTWFWPRERALGVELERGRWTFGLTMDAPQPGRAHLIQASLHFR